MQKYAIMLMGLPLAGKTTWISDNINRTEYTVISADYIKELHPDYDPNHAYRLHEYSVKTAEKQLRGKSDIGVNIVMDTGSINNNYTVRLVKELKEKNYYVTLVHIRTPYQICLARNEVRRRKVPKEAIISKAIKEESQFHVLKALVDEVNVVEYFTNKHIFIDMDGVIAALSTLPIINGKIDFVNGEVHRYLPPVMPIISKLNSLQDKGYLLYILSAIPNSFSINEKNAWLDKWFPVTPKRRFFVNQGRHKAEMLDNLSQKLKLNKRDMVMIEDFHNTLYEIKNLGMNSMHVSEFLTHTFL